jgi:adenine-specific DNA methylase
MNDTTIKALINNEGTLKILVRNYNQYVAEQNAKKNVPMAFEQYVNAVVTAGGFNIDA